MQCSKHAVVIAGGGPTGLMLAGELALAGVDVAVVEKRENQEIEGSRAGGLHSRSIEVLDQRGIADRFVSQGEKHHKMHFAGAVFDASDRPSRHNYTLALWQEKIEQGLADWTSELPVQFYRGCAVTDFSEDGGAITVALDDGRSLGAQYLVGCDGGRSIVRKMAGIGFPGWDPDISYLIFEATMTQPTLGISHGPRGVYAIGPLEGDNRFRGVITERHLGSENKPVMDDVREALIAAYDTDFEVRDVTWLSRFTDAARQADTYRKGRILLAGDAAHVHSPAGGQGLNIGLQDAVNLGWKLAQVVKGISPNSLLDTYHDERHPIGAALLNNTLALTALNRGDARSNALREMMATVIQMETPRKWYAAQMSGLDVQYDLGEGHPLLGRRMPDLDIITTDGPTTVFKLLHDARPVLLNFGERDSINIEQPEGRIKLIDATFEGFTELPVLGEVKTPEAILIRPDGHVAWVDSGIYTSLGEVIATWFGQYKVSSDKRAQYSAGTR